jgi:hypothetical protein
MLFLLEIAADPAATPITLEQGLSLAGKHQA